MNPSTTPRAPQPEPDASWMTRGVLYGTVAVTDAAVMVLELLGTRLDGKPVQLGPGRR
jgi:hypothetical protein